MRRFRFRHRSTDYYFTYVDHDDGTYTQESCENYSDVSGVGRRLATESCPVNDAFWAIGPFGFIVCDLQELSSPRWEVEIE